MPQYLSGIQILNTDLKNERSNYRKSGLKPAMSLWHSTRQLISFSTGHKGGWNIFWKSLEIQPVYENICHSICAAGQVFYMTGRLKPKRTQSVRNWAYPRSNGGKYQ